MSRGLRTGRDQGTTAARQGYDQQERGRPPVPPSPRQVPPGDCRRTHERGSCCRTPPWCSTSLRGTSRCSATCPPRAGARGSCPSSCCRCPSWRASPGCDGCPGFQPLRTRGPAAHDAFAAAPSRRRFQAWSRGGSGRRPCPTSSRRRRRCRFRKLPGQKARTAGIGRSPDRGEGCGRQSAPRPSRRDRTCPLGPEPASGPRPAARRCRQHRPRRRERCRNVRRHLNSFGQPPVITGKPSNRSLAREQQPASNVLG